MSELRPILEQLQAYVGQNAQIDAIANALPLAITALVVGIGLSVLGAKLAKPGVALMLALAGGAVGVAYARAGGLPQPVLGLVGAIMFAMIGHLTFRIWVGVATALVASSIALGAFSEQRVLPHYAEYETVHLPVASDSVTFAVPSAEQRGEYFNTPPSQFFEQFWAFVKQRDAAVELDAGLVGYGAGIIGLFLGVVAVRWMLVLSTSLVGTALVAGGVATLFDLLVPGSLQALQAHPSVMGMAVGGFLVTSLILQTLLTRKAPSSKEEKPAKS